LTASPPFAPTLKALDVAHGGTLPVSVARVERADVDACTAVGSSVEVDPAEGDDDEAEEHAMANAKGKRPTTERFMSRR
jgi:hypothetical protein